MLPQQHVIPMSEQQDNCGVCQKNFCVLRRRYNCLRCGEVICSSCSSVRTAHVPDIGDRQLRVCTACVLEARRTSRLVSPDSPVPLSTTSASIGRGFGSSTPRSKLSFAASTEPVDIVSARSGPSSCRGGFTRTGNFSYLNNDDDDNNSQDSASVCNSTSSTPKRRSYDDVLEPVRSRLIEYKTFSSATESGGVNVQKANFPPRSFSDGLIMRRGALFSKRRGSPADLAISIEAFRLHRQRMGGNSFTSTGDYSVQDDCASVSSDDGSCASSSPEHSSARSWASSARSRLPATTNSHGSPPKPPVCGEGETLSPLYAIRPVIESREARRAKKVMEFEAAANAMNDNQASSPTSPVSDSEGNPFELTAAMQMAQDIIVATERTHHLAQRVRKLSHHRILALQREDLGLVPSPSHGDNQQQHQQQQHQPSASPRRDGERDKSGRRVSPVSKGAILLSQQDLEEAQSPSSRGNNQPADYCEFHQRQHDLIDRSQRARK